MINIINFIKSFKNLLLYFLLISILDLYLKNSVFSLLLTTFIIIIINKELFNKKIIDFKKNTKKYLILMIKYWLIGLTLMLISNTIINNITNSIAINETLNRQQIYNSFINSFIIMVLLNPICEEIIYRGSFKTIFNNKTIYCIFTSLLFGLMHVIFNSDIIYMIPYALMGYYLAKTYYETDNIYTSIIMHIWHNLLMIILIITGVMI